MTLIPEILLLLQENSLTATQRILGYQGSGNSFIRKALLREGIPPEEYTLSRSRITTYRNHNTEVTFSSALSHMQVLIRNGITVYKCPPRYADGVSPQKSIGLTYR